MFPNIPYTNTSAIEPHRIVYLRYIESPAVVFLPDLIPGT